MKKIIITIVLSFLFGFAFSQEGDKKLTHIVTATFDSKKEVDYLFYDRLDQSKLLFAAIEPRILEKVNLNDDSLIGLIFIITYGSIP
jgi:hypothetical protein